MKIISVILVLLWAQCALAATDAVSLAGQWRFELDRSDAGVAAGWFNRALSSQIQLPASLPERGIGDDITLQTQWTGGINDPSFFTAPQYAVDREPGRIRIPFWLQPEKYYAGVAWFQRDIKVPAGWKNRRVMLFLERAHWETRVWVDDRCIGANDSLSTPHEYDLGPLSPGPHLLSIRVDNRRIVEIGENSHAISDHTQGNWNGIVGRIELRSTPLVWVDDLQIYPHLASRSVTVKGRIGNETGAAAGKDLQLVISEKGKNVAEKGITLQVDANGSDFETEISLGPTMDTWDEFHPALYTAKASMDGSVREAAFGMREISTQGTQFLINGRKTFIRGTLECCIFPKTGHPPTDVADWKRILRIARSYGLNLLRFHSYCPPEAAFIAGDEMGFYFQVETCWANQSVTIGDGQPVDRWVYEETARILKACGNHPSFLFMPYGNEPGGKNVEPYLAKYVEHFKSLDPRRLWTGGSGWPQLAENQFHITPDPRIQRWGEGVKSRINALPPETTTDYRDYISKRTVPVISHEIGQWCVFPNLAEIPKYTGYLKPKNFEIFRDTLDANALGSDAHSFLIASGKLQALCYKEDIESALRTPGMGGFELLDLHDFPGQGTALVGVLDPFWEDKGYITAKEYSRFCNSTVPLARLAKRVFTTDESLTAGLEIANFGPEPLKAAEASWKLVADDDRTIARGTLPAKDIPIDNGIQLGRIAVDLKNCPAPAHCRLVASVAGFENDWDVWVYPGAANAPREDIMVTTHFDDAARARLQAGGKVLLTIPGAKVANYDEQPVKLGFSSIFWNTSWTGRQAPTTLGILCDPRHPALAEFPTASHSDWQWWYLIHRAGALRMDDLSPGMTPVVRIIDDWVTSRSLGLIVEARVGKGKIMICGFDLVDGADDPVSRQMRHSLEDYMASTKFAPADEIVPAQIENLIASNAPKPQAGISHITADSEQAEYEAAKAIDGDSQTIWHTSWEDGAPGFPHYLTMELSRRETLEGFTALPRQDGNHNGWIKEYQFFASRNGRDWGEPVATGVFSNDASLKTVKFPEPVKAKYVKLVAVSSYTGSQWASLAEFHLIEAGQP